MKKRVRSGLIAGAIIGGIIPIIATGIAIPFIKQKGSVDVSTDKKNVDKINNLLKNTSFDTMSEMVLYLSLCENPIDLEALNPAGNTQYVWDKENNVIFTMDENGNAVVKPDGYTVNPKKNQIWKMVQAPKKPKKANGMTESFVQHSDYGQYLRTASSSTSLATDITFSSSLDTGFNPNLTLTYEAPKSKPTEAPIVATYRSDLKVNGSLSDINHYGHAKSIEVETLGDGFEYNEYGTVDGNIIVSSGTFNAKPTSDINTILIDNPSVKINVEANKDEEEYAVVGTIGRTDNVTKEQAESQVEISKDIPSEEKPEPKYEEEGSTPISDRYQAGLGTAKSPYVISDSNQLLNCQDDVNNNNKADNHFILGDNIDMDGVPFTGIGVKNSQKQIPFTGTFNGQGYTISNLTISQDCGTKTYGFGMFNYVKGSSEYKGFKTSSEIWDSQNNKIIYDKIIESNYGSSIKNIILDKVDIQITGLSYSVGAIVGMAENCYLANNWVKSGTVLGQKTVGGIAGTTASSVCLNCVCGDDTDGAEELTVKASVYNVGGIVGLVGYNTTFLDNNAYLSCSTGKNTKIIAEANENGGGVGGIVGTNFSASNSIVDDCVNNATIQSQGNSDPANTRAAGIVGFGQNFFTISNCINNGKIETIENGQVQNAAGITCEPNTNLIYNCINSKKGTVDAYATDGVAGIASGNTIALSSPGVNICKCSNSATLNNKNTTPAHKTADIASGLTAIVFQNMTFNNVAEISELISSNGSHPDNPDSIKVIFRQCDVKDKTGTLQLPSKIANISSDNQICSNIRVNSNLTNLYVNIPGSTITVTEQTNCEINSSADNSSIIISQNAQIKKAIVTGSNSKVINNGIVTRTIGIDGASSFGENNGTCANITFGKTSVSTCDKSFTNRGTITGLTDPTDADNNNVIFTKGDATNDKPLNHTITINNYGTIKYQNNSLATPVGFFRMDALCMHIIFNAYNNSKLETDTADNWYSIFNNSDSIKFRYQSDASITEKGNPLTYPELAAKSNYATAEEM